MIKQLIMKLFNVKQEIKIEKVPKGWMFVLVMPRRNFPIFAKMTAVALSRARAAGNDRTLGFAGCKAYLVREDHIALKQGEH